MQRKLGYFPYPDYLKDSPAFNFKAKGIVYFKFDADLSNTPPEFWGWDIMALNGPPSPAELEYAHQNGCPIIYKDKNNQFIIYGFQDPKWQARILPPLTEQDKNRLNAFCSAGPTWLPSNQLGTLETVIKSAHPRGKYELKQSGLKALSGGNLKDPISGNLIDSIIWPSPERMYHGQKLLHLLSQIPSDEKKATPTERKKKAALIKAINYLSNVQLLCATDPAKGFSPREDFKDKLMTEELLKEMGYRDYADFNIKGGFNELRRDLMQRVAEARMEQHPGFRDKVLTCCETGLLLVEISNFDSEWGAGFDGYGESLLGQVMTNVGNAYLAKRDKPIRIDEPREEHANIRSVQKHSWIDFNPKPPKPGDTRKPKKREKYQILTCDITLLSRPPKESELEEAQNNNRPLLMKRGSKFFIYGCMNEKWAERQLNLTSAEGAILEKYFENYFKDKDKYKDEDKDRVNEFYLRNAIFKTDSEFLAILEKGHNQYQYGYMLAHDHMLTWETTKGKCPASEDIRSYDYLRMWDKLPPTPQPSGAEVKVGGTAAPRPPGITVAPLAGLPEMPESGMELKIPAGGAARTSEEAGADAKKSPFVNATPGTSGPLFPTGSPPAPVLSENLPSWFEELEGKDVTIPSLPYTEMRKNFILGDSSSYTLVTLALKWAQEALTREPPNIAGARRYLQIATDVVNAAIKMNDNEFLNRKDSQGNTAVHLAIIGGCTTTQAEQKTTFRKIAGLLSGKVTVEARTAAEVLKHDTSWCSDILSKVTVSPEAAHRAKYRETYPIWYQQILQGTVWTPTPTAIEDINALYKETGATLLSSAISDLYSAKPDTPKYIALKDFIFKAINIKDVDLAKPDKNNDSALHQAAQFGSRMPKDNDFQKITEAMLRTGRINSHLTGKDGKTIQQRLKVLEEFLKAAEDYVNVTWFDDLVKKLSEEKEIKHDRPGILPGVPPPKPPDAKTTGGDTGKTKDGSKEKEQQSIEAQRRADLMAAAAKALETKLEREKQAKQQAEEIERKAQEAKRKAAEAAAQAEAKKKEQEKHEKEKQEREQKEREKQAKDLEARKKAEEDRRIAAAKVADDERKKAEERRTAEERAKQDAKKRDEEQRKLLAKLAEEKAKEVERMKAAEAERIKEEKRKREEEERKRTEDKEKEEQRKKADEAEAARLAKEKEDKGTGKDSKDTTDTPPLGRTNVQGLNKWGQDSFDKWFTIGASDRRHVQIVKPLTSIDVATERLESHLKELEKKESKRSPDPPLLSDRQRESLSRFSPGDTRLTTYGRETETKIPDELAGKSTLKRCGVVTTCSSTGKIGIDVVLSQTDKDKMKAELKENKDVKDRHNYNVFLLDFAPQIVEDTIAAWKASGSKETPVIRMNSISDFRKHEFTPVQLAMLQYCQLKGVNCCDQAGRVINAGNILKDIALPENAAEIIKGIKPGATRDPTIIHELQPRGPTLSSGGQ